MDLDGLRRGAARAAFGRAMGTRLPRVDGIVVVTGTDREVVVHRDGWHVPHVEAHTRADAWFGIGFAVGQDRAFQLTSYQRVVRGTLAAMVGEDGLAIDRFSRRLGLAHRAQRILDAQGPGTHQALTAYAAGVTAGMQRGVPVRPHELALARADLQDFTAADAAGTMLLFSFSLAANWDAELARLAVLTLDGEEALRKVSPQPAGHLPVTSPPGATMGAVIDRLARDLALLADALPLDAASNNWALAGTRTASGRPIVANDPHLPPTIPPYWYLAHVTTPAWSVAGACLVGAPAIVAGHNGHAAWGVTAGRTDSTDLFLEQVDGHRLRDDDHPDGWIECAVRREVIEVRSSIPGRPARLHVEDVLEGPRGPVTGPAIDGAPDALSMSATWWDELPLDGFLGLTTARTAEDIRSSFANWPMHLNLVWAEASREAGGQADEHAGGDDGAGRIGWQLLGNLPRRRSGNGAIPLPGWLADVGWHDDRVMTADLPGDDAPGAGFLATANNPPVVDDPDTPELGIDFADGYRLRSITEALAARDDWTVEACQQLQRSTRTGTWTDLRPHLLGADTAGSPSAARAQRLLVDWDGDMAADSVAGSVFQLAVANLTVAVVRAAAPNAADAMLGASYTPLAEHAFMALQRTAHLAELLVTRPNDWLDWNRAVIDALAGAVDQLAEQFGKRPSRWAWGRIRQPHLHHVITETVGALAPVFNVPLPAGGDTHTISPQTVVPIAPLANPLGIANLRLVIDLADVESSRFALAGGQSGNPCSPHYDDQLGPWDAGGIPIPFAPAHVQAATRHTLRLVPGNA